MSWTIGELTAQVLLSLRAPRQGARSFIGWDIPDRAIAPLAILSAIFFTIGAELLSTLNPPAPDQPYVYIPPLTVACILLGTLGVMSLAISVLGQAFGGKGNFKRTLAVMSWLQFVWFWIFLPLGLLTSLPTVVLDILTLAALLYMLWVMSAFVAELHEMKGIWLAFLVVLLASLLASVVFMAVIGFIGVTVMGVDSFG